MIVYGALHVQSATFPPQDVLFGADGLINDLPPQVEVVRHRGLKPEYLEWNKLKSTNPEAPWSCLLLDDQVARLHA